MVSQPMVPASVQTHRKLVRYRILLADTLGSTARVTYLDDEQPNFAYFVYNGAPSWTGRNQPPSSAPTTFAPQQRRSAYIPNPASSRWVKSKKSC